MNIISEPKRGGTVATQTKRAQATRTAIIAAARLLFTEMGYNATGTHDIVMRASVTRGALYHHFTNKLELFEAVFRICLEELNTTAQKAVAGLSGDYWAQIKGAFTYYLKLIASNGDYQQILLIEGPSALGWNQWRALHSEYVAADIVRALRLLMDLGIVAERPAEALANLILAALNDAALSIAFSDDPSATSTEAAGAFIFMLEGMQTLKASRL